MLVKSSVPLKFHQVDKKVTLKITKSFCCDVVRRRLK